MELKHSGLMVGGWGGGRYLKLFLRRGDICSWGVFFHGRAAGEQPGRGEKGAVVSQISLGLLPGERMQLGKMERVCETMFDCAKI